MTRGATFPFGYQVPDPGVGDIDNLRAIAASRTANSEQVGQALAKVRFIAGDIPSHWGGSAAEMNLRATLALVPDLDILKTSYENHASALTTYTAAVERIRTAAAPQIAAYHQASNDIFGWRIQRDDIKVGYPVPREYEPIFGAPAGLYDEDDWRRAVILDGYIEGAEETMSGLRGALDGLVADRATADQICAAALSSAKAKGPFSTIDADKNFTQKELFSLLARLSPTEAALFLNSHASALKRLAGGNPGNADDIAKLWLSLGAGATAVAKDYPDIVGNLEGASSWDRGVANKIVLDREITAAEYGLEHGGNRAPDYYRYRLDTLQNIKFAVGAGLDTTPPRTIHSLDTGDTVLASVVLGDLDNADCASYNVPGMDTTVHDSMTDWTTASKGFYDEQASLLVAGGLSYEEAPQQVAVVSWIGYDTPNKLTVSSAYEAFIGAKKLDDSVAGTNAQRHLHTPDGRVGVIAHSYGSSTAMIALSKATHVDTLVTYGSAGEVIGSHPILNDGWYQTQAPDDHIATLGQVLGYRPSPLIDSSSQPLDSQSGHWANPSTGKLEYVTSSHDHSGYLIKNTASLHNMAAVTIGRTDLLSVPEGSNPRPNIAPTPPK